MTSKSLTEVTQELQDRCVGSIYGSITNISGRKGKLTTRDLSTYDVKLRFPYSEEEHSGSRNWLVYPRNATKRTVFSVVRPLPQDVDCYNYFLIVGMLMRIFPAPSKGGAILISPFSAPPFTLTVFGDDIQKHKLGEVVELEARLVVGKLQVRDRKMFFPCYQ